jgi:hypothetical protein
MIALSDYGNQLLSKFFFSFLFFVVAYQSFAVSLQATAIENSSNV